MDDSISRKLPERLARLVARHQFQVGSFGEFMLRKQLFDMRGELGHRSFDGKREADVVREASRELGRGSERIHCLQPIGESFIRQSPILQARAPEKTIEKGGCLQPPFC